MRNLSYREAMVSLVLIAAASVIAYQLWFVPALAQIERDRHTVEKLIATLARPAASAKLHVAASAMSSTPSARIPLSPPLQAKKPKEPRRERGRGSLSTNLGLSCTGDSKDPLCGTLDL